MYTCLQVRQCACLYTCQSTFLHTSPLYAHVYPHVYPHVYTHVLFVSLCTCLDTCLYVRFTCPYTCQFTCTPVYTHVYAPCLHTCLYTHTYSSVDGRPMALHHMLHLLQFLTSSPAKVFLVHLRRYPCLHSYGLYSCGLYSNGCNGLQSHGWRKSSSCT